MAPKPLVSLNLMVDKSTGRVIFAESDAHFADILLSFLTLPLASILRLTANTTSLGSINNLFASVENLSGNFFRSKACRAMLLQPLNSAANLLTSLPIDYDTGSHRLHFSYLCSDRSCYASELSFYANTRCRCGKIMDRREHFVAHKNVSSTTGHKSGVFLENSLLLTISDDLHVFQSSVEVSVDLLAKLDIKQKSSIESMNVNVTVEKIHELLKRMLVSDTPLTDVFLGGGGGGHSDGDKLQINEDRSETTAVKSTSSRRISTKLYLNKGENKVLFAEAGKDFAEFLASFLTFPMGSVVNKLGGKSGIRCFDNLYNSIEGLKSANCFKQKAHALVEMLLKPLLPPYFSLKDNNLMKIDEQPETGTRYYTCCAYLCDSNEVRTVANVKCNACDLKSILTRLTLTDPRDGGEFLKSSRYMVTDDLVLKQLSSVMVVAGILEEDGGSGGFIVRNVEIGEEEALLLLQASVTSKNVLTDALLGKNEGRNRRRMKLLYI